MANQGFTIKVTGLRELIARGDAAATKGTKKLVRDGLRDAVQPTRAEAARLIMPFDARTAAGFRISVRKTGSVSVEQGLKKSSNPRRRRKNYGRLQMRKALIPGFEHTYPIVVENMQKKSDELARLFVGN